MQEVNRVLELLYDRGDGYFALGELGATAKVHRERLQSVLEFLQQRGYRMEFSPIHGVRLSRPMRLDGHLIERNLAAQRIGRHVICFEEVDSTNDVAFDSARQADADGLAVLAEFQRCGRGRLGRAWVSPPQANVLLSVLLIDPAARLPHEALTIAVGLAVAEGIEASTHLEGRLKWPNDVLLEGRKVAGVLVEVRNVADTRAVVIGVGINANACPPDEEVDLPATSLAWQLHHPVERIEVVRAVLQRLDEWTHRVEAGRLDELHTAWLARCGMLNERITVVSGGEHYVGRALDVSPLEGLILLCDDGRQVHLPAASSTVVSSPI